MTVANKAKVKMNVKDFPEHGLRLIGPSDSKFDQLLSAELQNQSAEVIEAVKPYSVFLENRSDNSVVACVIEWAFTTPAGRNEYYREGVFDAHALMEAPQLSDVYKRQSGHIEPNGATLYSLLSTDGTSPMRIPLSPGEGELFKQGKLDRAAIVEKTRSHLQSYTDITVTIDSAIFEDGSFVGTNSSGFFERAKAAIQANQDLLDEISLAQNSKQTSSQPLYARLEEMANSRIDRLDSDSTPNDYYNYFKALYANDVLQSMRQFGDDKGIHFALTQKRRAWPKLHKK